MPKLISIFNLPLAFIASFLVLLVIAGQSSPSLAHQSSAHMDLAISFDIERSLLSGSARLILPPGDTLDLYVQDLEITAALLSNQSQENMVLSLQQGNVIHIPPSDSEQRLLLSYEKVVTDSFNNVLDQQAIVLTSAWHPLPDHRLTYSLQARLPHGFSAISESDTLPVAGSDGVVQFSFSQPVYSLTFAAAPYVIKSRTVREGLDVYTYFFPEDAALADDYLKAAAGYITRYEALIGPFPYNHYVIAENIRPTGYGLPTFTLLGQQVLRLPFIINTSLGHEILHSWFGNSVEMSPSSGNWVEGLTTYLADVAYRDDNDEGPQARRELIQNYLSYVRASTPPLGEFRGAGHGSRFNQDQRAVGYGRSAMLFHELRQRVGADVFARAIQKLYSDFKGNQASWDDIRALFETEAETDLQVFFRQRLSRTELPELGIDTIRLDQGPTETRLTFNIVQKQQEPFELFVPITIETISGVTERRERIDNTSTEVSITLDSMAIAIVLDAHLDLMRQPSKAEAIPTWSQIMGAESCLVILADEQQREKFQPFLELAGEYSWQVALSSDLSAADLMGKTLVFLGISSAHSRSLFGIPDHSGEGFSLDVRGNPLDPPNLVALVTSENLQETQAATSRLSHYGKYSFLHFSGGHAVEKSIAAAESGLRVRLQERPSGIAATALTDFDQLIDELLDHRVIYVGETHTSRADHLLQQMVIEALYTRLESREIELVIGMEMFPASSQPALDAYIDDPTVEEARFLKESRYYDVWRYDYRLFRPIFSFARKHRIPVIGLNLEREVVSSVFQSGGIQNLGDSQRQNLPVDRQLDLPGYVERLTATHSMHQSASHDSSANLVGFIEAQALWDETMAATVVAYLQKHPRAAMVVLAGSQHTRKDSGIPPRVARRLEVKQASLANLATSPLSGKMLSDTADYLFLLEARDYAPQGKIGIVLEEKPYRSGTIMEIVGLTPQSNAEASGLKQGDLLISIEGQQIQTMVEVQAAMLDRLAGETTSLVIRRTEGGTEADRQISIELFDPNSPRISRPHP